MARDSYHGNPVPELPKPRPNPVPATQPYWDALCEDRIVVQKCAACATWVFYPRSRCTTCMSEDLVWHEITGAGRIVTWSVTAQPTAPMFADETPQIIAVVETDEGVRMTTTLVVDDPSTLRVGGAVAPVFDHGDDGATLLRFRPTTGSVR